MDVYRFTEEGSSHRSRGVGNQDACRVERHDPHCLAFLADGMGSARYGGAAAGIAVGVGLDMARCALVPQRGIDDESGRAAVQAAFSSAYGALQRTARNERELNALLSTLMAVYYNERTGCLHFGYCGDGGLIVLGDDGRMRLATPPHKGQTAFQTTSLLDFESWTFGTIERVRAWAMLTDGLFDALCPDGVVPEGGQREEALRGVFDAPRHLDDPRMRPYLDASFSPSAPSPDDLGELFDAVTDDRSIVVVRGSDAAFSRRALDATDGARRDASAEAARAVTPAFVASRAEAGACVFDAQGPSLAGEAGRLVAGDGPRAASSVCGASLLRTLSPDEAGRVRTVMEARRGARRHGGRSHRMEEAGHAHV